MDGNVRQSEHAFLKEARERYQMAVDADREQAEKAIDDLKFLDPDPKTGGQWTPEDLKLRQGRICLSMDKTSEKLDHVLGALKQNEATIKAIPADDGAADEVAEVVTGMIRNIEDACDAEGAKDWALTSAAACGRGFWRVLTDYVDDDTFDQHIYVEPIPNCMSVHWDPSAKRYDKSDGLYWFIDQLISRSDYKRRWPGKNPADFDNEQYNTEDYRQWVQKDNVRVAEYFYKEFEKKTLYYYEPLTPEGEPVITFNEIPDVKPSKTREVTIERIKWCMIDGVQILDKKDWVGRYFPIIPVWGKMLNIDGKEITKSVFRNAKDPQRVLNFWWSALTETVALSPKVPWLVTPKQIAGFEAMWRGQYHRNYPYLYYNPDPSAPGGKPFREPPPTIPTGMVQILALASDGIKSGTGIYDASLGARSNETSGVAIQARKIEGEVANFEFAKNYKRSLKYYGKVMMDLIPRIYDTPRVVRIVHPDKRDELITINQIFKDKQGREKEITIRDIKLEARVEIGPAYTTMRQESARSMMEFVKAIPPAGMATSDLIAASMDWPDAEEFAKRLKRTLPPELTVDLPDEETDQDGRPIQQAPPMPQQGQAGPPQKTGADPELEMAKEKAELDKAVAEAMQAKLDVQIKKAKLEQEKAKVGQVAATNIGG